MFHLVLCSWRCRAVACFARALTARAAKVLAGATAMMTMITINRFNMNKLLLAIVPALLLFAGCAKEKPQEPAPVFTGVMEQGISTKSSVEYDPAIMRYQVKWQSTDLVRINEAKYSVAPESPATKATFTKVDGDVPAGTYKACVPYDEASYDTGTKVMTVTFPSSITNVPQNISFWPMYAESTSTNLAFKNLAGLVAISILNPSSQKVKSVKITSSGNYLSGVADIVADVPGWKASLSSGSDNITVDCSASPLDVGSWNYVFVPVPPKEYGQNFTITITYEDDTKTVKNVKAGSSIVVQRSKVTSIALNLFSPGSTANEDIGFGESYTESDFE